MKRGAIVLGALASTVGLIALGRASKAATPPRLVDEDAPPAPSFPERERPPAPPPPPEEWEDEPPPEDAPSVGPAEPPPPATPPPRDVDPRRALAAQTAARLWELSSDPNQTTDDDRGLIAAFQQQEGLTPNGRYMAGTGLAFVKYNIVPPKPFYWPRGANSDTNVKANWRSNMLFQATQDPVRAEEWQRIAMV